MDRTPGHILWCPIWHTSIEREREREKTRCVVKHRTRTSTSLLIEKPLSVCGRQKGNCVWCVRLQVSVLRRQGRKEESGNCGTEGDLRHSHGNGIRSVEVAVTRKNRSSMISSQTEADKRTGPPLLTNIFSLPLLLQSSLSQGNWFSNIRSYCVPKMTRWFFV